LEEREKGRWYAEGKGRGAGAMIGGEGEERERGGSGKRNAPGMDTERLWGDQK
jgi:hypothetical protein